MRRHESSHKALEDDKGPIITSGSVSVRSLCHQFRRHLEVFLRDISSDSEKAKTMPIQERKFVSWFCHLQDGAIKAIRTKTKKAYEEVEQ